jgi:hypothetical protein
MVTDREEKAKIKEEELGEAHRQGKKDTLKEAKTNDAHLTKLRREEQKKSSDLEKELASTTATMNILQLDLDAYVVENQELKGARGLAHTGDDEQQRSQLCATKSRNTRSLPELPNLPKNWQNNDLKPPNQMPKQQRSLRTRSWRTLNSKGHVN